MAFLKRASGGSPGQIIELKQDRTVIGRSPEHCHIVLDPNGVSRRHAEIYKKGEEYYLADLNSRNMTKVNNTKLLPGNRAPARRGRPDQHLRRRVPVLSQASHRERQQGSRRDRHRAGRRLHEVPHLHTLDASRSSAMASMVKPEVKLKAILEITRNLSTELKIDKVGPAHSRLADGAVSPGGTALPDPGRSRHQAAGAQGVSLSARQAGQFHLDRFRPTRPSSASAGRSSTMSWCRKRPCSARTRAWTRTCPPAPRSPTSRSAR